jgi:DNA-binding transcriptional MerR regulator
MDVMSKTDGVADLSIGDLAERTGVSTATLRVWESRHGFPVPHRRASGHRRYDDQHVALVRDVQRRRDNGVRLDVAIAQVVAERAGRPAPKGAPGAPSVYAHLRRTYPALAPQRLTKGTLLALSWAIEDEFASRAQRGHLFGAFQRAPHFESAEARWSDLARTMASTLVFADFAPGTGGAPKPGEPVRVPLPADHPMGREWAVVVDSDDLSVALTAWEIPGQTGVRDRDRIFESIWTVEREAVREAARVCAQVAVDLDIEEARDVATQMTEPLGPARIDLGQVTSLFNRVVAYVGDQK